MLTTVAQQSRVTFSHSVRLSPSSPSCIIQLVDPVVRADTVVVLQAPSSARDGRLTR